jgi:hypothetical protein
MKYFSLVERQNEIFRAIRRSNIALATHRTPSKTLVKENSDLKETAAKLFAAINGWELYPTPEHFCLHGLAGQENCDPCCIRHLLWDPLVFIDQSKRPKALVEQSHDPGHANHRRAGELGLKVSTPPAYYASISDPGESNFAAYTHPDTCVKWLPEQMEHNGPFAVDFADATRFKDFLEQFRTDDADCMAFISHLRSFSSYGRRRWAPPEEIVSLSHLNAYIYHLPAHDFDYEVVARTWSHFELWRKEQVSMILRFNEDILEISR